MSPRGSIRGRAWFAPSTTSMSSSEGRPAAASSVSSRQQLMQHAVSLNDYCASVIQRAWRASRERRYRRYLRRPMYRIAAGSIQRWWRERLIELGNKRSVRVMAATTIQRAYRQFADRKIYRFFRQLLLSREHANPLLLLRTLQAPRADSRRPVVRPVRAAAAWAAPRSLRSSTTKCSPLSTSRTSAASRHGTTQPTTEGEGRPRKATPGGPAAAHAEDGDRTDVQYWYRRWENNGWRVVGGQLLLGAQGRRHREEQCGSADVPPSQQARQESGGRETKEGEADRVDEAAVCAGQTEGRGRASKRRRPRS